MQEASSNRRWQDRIQGVAVVPRWLISRFGNQTYLGSDPDSGTYRVCELG